MPQVNGSADSAELAAAVAHVAAFGGPVTAAVLDVTDTTAYAAHLARIEAAIGPLTTLVNNAGVGVLTRGDLLDVTEASFYRCLAVNTRAMFFLSQAFARLLLARPRDPALFHAIVNVTSANASAVAVQRAEYKCGISARISRPWH